VKIKKHTGEVATRPGAQAPRYHGLRPQINVSVALSTLLGTDEQPGELDGHGPIPADLARRLAADPSGTWRRLVTDELGHLVDYGRTTYEPPTDLAQFVIARDRTCRAPGCERPAATSADQTVHERQEPPDQAAACRYYPASRSTSDEKRETQSGRGDTVRP
jgi:hypothetical protein